MATEILNYTTIRLNSPTKHHSISISLKLNKKEPQAKVVTVELKSSSPQPVTTVTSSLTQKKENDFDLCEECGKSNSSENYCPSCFTLHFQENFGKWKSGNSDIDELIKSSQTSGRKQRVFLEWIPYDDLRDVKYVSRGGFSTIYSAFWTKGQIINWNKLKGDWDRKGEIKVALKRLYNSQNISQDFLYEFEVSLFHCSGHHHEKIMPIYGITQDPITKDFMIVTKFIEQGSLRNFIYNNFISLSWLQKLELLRSIAIGLDKIHSSGLSHNNFHSGNILINNKETLSTIISDLGISGPADRSHNTVGVIQYTPPEILHGRIYTKYSDIYYFGMLMYEISIGVPPFIGVPSNQLNDLIFDICDGRRPRYNSKDIPKCFETLMKQCWDDDMFSRPLSSQLVDTIGNWIKEIKENNKSDICEQFNKCGQQQIRLKHPLIKYDAYKSQSIRITDLGEDDFENYNEQNPGKDDEGIKRDDGIELDVVDVERRARNKLITLKRSDLMKWLKDVEDTFDPNQLYPKYNHVTIGNYGSVGN